MSVTWRTSEGKNIDISDMDDDHLLNTIKWLRRKDFGVTSLMGGEDMEGIWADTVHTDHTVIYFHMMFEALYRGILPTREPKKNFDFMRDVI